MCISRPIHVYCTDRQSINNSHLAFQKNSEVISVVIFCSMMPLTKPEAFLSIDMIRSSYHVMFSKAGPDWLGKSKMAGQVKNGNILS